MKTKKYYFSYGDYETWTPFDEPTEKALHQWWNEFKNINPYDCYLHGSMLEMMYGHHTGKKWDVDIILTSKVDDIDQLRDVLREGFKMGTRFNIRVDIKYQSRLPEYKNFKPHYLIRPFNSSVTMIGDNVYQRNYYSPNMITLPNGLVQHQIDEETKMWEKWYVRTEAGLYLGLNPKKLEEIFG
jgi:hypothetical protein